MFFEAEDTTVVKADALKNAIAVKQAMVEHGNFRLGLRHKFSVEINRQFARRGGRRLRLRINRRLNGSFRLRFRLVDYRTTSCRGFCYHVKNVRWFRRQFK